MSGQITGMTRGSKDRAWNGPALRKNGHESIDSLYTLREFALAGEDADSGGKQASGTEEGYRGVADVDPEELLKDVRATLEDFEGPGAESRRLIEQQHCLGHEVGHPAKANVLPLIVGEIAGAESFAERDGLTEAEAEALSGDGVDGAGGVADEGDVAARDAMKFSAEGDRTARGVAGGGGLETLLELRELIKGLLDGRELLARDKGDADLGGRDGSDVGLSVVAPIDLDEVGLNIRQGIQGEVLAEADAAGADRGAIETGPGADARLMAVGSDDIAGPDGVAVGAD